MGGSEDLAMQMFGSLFGSLLDGIFSAPSTASSTQQAIRQQQLAKQKQEALKQQVIQLRKEREAQAAQAQAEKIKRGKEVLAKMGPIGSKLEPFSWDTPKLEAKSIGSGVFDTAGYSSWQRLLCSAYFSNKALDAARGGDSEGARYMNMQSDRVTTGEMIDVACEMPGLQQLADIQQQNLKVNSRMTQMVKLMPLMQEGVKRLQQTELKLHEAKQDKKAAEVKLKEADNKVEEIRVQTQSAQTPEKKSAADDLLAQALALQDDASSQLEKVKEEEQKFAELRDKEIKVLKEMQQQMNAGTVINNQANQKR